MNRRRHGDRARRLSRLFGFLHLVDGVLQVLLQPPDLGVHTHLLVGLQLGYDLEGAVGRLDEPQLADVGPREGVDGGTTVTSLHEADGLPFCLWRVREEHERSQHRDQLHVHRKNPLLMLSVNPK